MVRKNIRIYILIRKNIDMNTRINLGYLFI